MVVLLATVPGARPAPDLRHRPGVGAERSVKIRQRSEEAVAEQKRLADELFALTSAAAPAKELRVYGLTDELISRHHALGTEVSTGIARAAIRGAVVCRRPAGWCSSPALSPASRSSFSARSGPASAGEVVLAVVLASRA